jgi:hypothetical protein
VNRLRRAVLILAATITVLLMAPVSAAASMVASSQTPGALAWITLTDSRGISIWNYEMSIDRGDGLIPNPGKMFWSSLVDMLWSAYRAWVALAVWFLDWVMGLDWLTLAATPFITIGTAMEAVVTKIGVTNTFLLVTFVAAVVWIIRGRWATGIWEVTMSLVIGALAAGVLAHPVKMIAGPDGWIATAQRSGQEVALELTGGEGGLSGTQTQALVDVFVRKPHELVNFGKILDGGECEAAYTAAVRGGPYGGESDIRDAVGGCDEALGEYAENPSVSMVIDGIFLGIGAGVLVLVVASIGGSVLVAGMVLLWESARGIINLLIGLLPGAARGPLFTTVGTIATRLALFFVSSIFLGLLVLLVDELLGSDATAKVFLLVDVVLAVAVVAWWRQRRNLEAASTRIAQALAARPGAGPVRLPGPGRHPGVGDVVSTGLRLAQLGATRRAATSAGNIYNQQLVIAGTGNGRVPPPPGRAAGGPRAAGGGSGGVAGQLPPGRPPGPSTLPSGRPPGRGGGPGAGRRVAGAAAGVGLLVASGGTSSAAQAARAARRLNAARRASRAVTGQVRPGPQDSSAVVPGRVISSESHRTWRTRSGPDGRVVLQPIPVDDHARDGRA